MNPMCRPVAVLLLLSLFVVPCFGQSIDAEEQALRERAAAIASSLDDRLLAGQVIMTGVDGKGRLSADMKYILGQCPPGAIMLFRYNLDTPKNEVKKFLDECREFVAPETGGAAGNAGLPPFIAVDHEGGSVHRFGPGVARLPAAASWAEQAKIAGREGALAALEEAVFQSGKEIRDLGITLNLAPVAEVLTGGSRLFLGERSFGADGQFTADASAAFIRGMDRAGIVCAAKHFPGNTGADPHETSVVLRGSREELALMAAPFAALIEARLPAVVMVSHALVPAWDRENIGSLSQAVIGDWLRGELGFTGIVLTDDFSMAAAVDTPRASSSRRSPESAAVRSLAAGADMVMAWPLNVRQIHGAIVAALKNGSLSRDRLREAAARIIAEKIRLGLVP
ncbi:glycosyl hydrolase [Spirochaetia bacterium]|nr:glycosyl hydrolase [Spirochaetia bacterium]